MTHTGPRPDAATSDIDPHHAVPTATTSSPPDAAGTTPHTHVSRWPAADDNTLQAVVTLLGKRPPKLGRTKLVLIDGPSGAGKTTFADRLAPVIDADVVHTDDLLDGWEDQFTYWERLQRRVLAPLRAGEPGWYRRYDWDKARFEEWIEVKPADVLIVEGVGAARAEGRSWGSLTIFVDAPQAVRKARSVARDGIALQAQLDKWRRREDVHFAADATAWCADVVIGSAS